MKKTNLKRLNEEQKSRAKNKKNTKMVGELRSETTKSSSESEKAKSLLECWKGEIKALKSEKFASYESALDSVICKVVQRLALPAAGRSKAKQFLNDMLASDPNTEKVLSRYVSKD